MFVCSESIGLVIAHLLGLRRFPVGTGTACVRANSLYACDVAGEGAYMCEGRCYVGGFGFGCLNGFLVVIFMAAIFGPALNCRGEDATNESKHLF